MAFNGYSIVRANVFNSSFREEHTEWKKTCMFDIVRNIKKENRDGDVIMVFEEDTEYNGYLLYSWFNDPYKGWTRDYNKTDIELSVLEHNGFFNC